MDLSAVDALDDTLADLGREALDNADDDNEEEDPDLTDLDAAAAISSSSSSSSASAAAAAAAAAVAAAATTDELLPGETASDRLKRQQGAPLKRTHHEYIEYDYGPKGQLRKKKVKRVARMGSILTRPLEKLYGEANDAFIDQDFPKAVSKLTMVIRQAPAAPGPWQTLGLVQQQMGEVKKAIGAFIVAAANSDAKDREHMWRTTAELAQQHDMLKEAVFCWDGVVKANPEDGNSRWTRSLLYAQLGDHRRAVSSLLQLLNRQPNNPTVLRELVQELVLTDQRRRAANFVSKHFKDTSKDVVDQADKAAAQRQPAPLQFDLDLANILADLYLDLEAWDELVAFISELTSHRRLMPGGPSAELPVDLTAKFGVAKIHLGDVDAANVTLTDLFNCDVQDYPDLFYEVGEAFMRTEMHERALDLFNMVVDVDGFNTPALWLRRAHCIKCSASNPQYREDALELYNKVLAAEPDNKEAKVGKASVEADMADPFALAAGLAAVQQSASSETFDPSIAPVLSAQAALAVGEDGQLGRISEDVDEKDVLSDQTNFKLMQMEGEALLRGNNFQGFLERCVKPMTTSINVALGYRVVTQRDADSSLSVAASKAAPKKKKKSKAEKSKPSTSAAAGLSEVDLVQAAAAAANKAVADAAKRMGSGDGEAEEEAEDEDEDEEEAGLVKYRIISPTKKVRLYDRTVFSLKGTVVPGVKDIVRSLQFLELTVKVVKALAFVGRNKDAMAIIHTVDHMVGSKDPKESHEVVSQLRFLAVGISINAGDFEDAYDHIRFVVQQRPDDLSVGRFFNIIINKLGVHSKTTRFMERILRKHPDSVPLRVLIGHDCMVHQNFDGALEKYASVLEDFATSAVTHLYMGIALMHKAMSRRSKDTRHQLMQAFSFMFRYHKMREDAESAYNLARAFHSIGFVHLAEPYYQEALSRSTTQGAKTGVDVRREAAHNLALVYRQSGSPELARKLYAEYCTI